MSDENPILMALAKALPELEGAKKNAANGAFKGTKYANLTSVIEAVKPVRAHGLWYRQVSHEVENGACIETIYIHENGVELSAGKLFVKADKATAQGNGSAVTYARRYSLQTAFGLDAEDDDGNAASAPPKISDGQIERVIDLLEAHNIPVGDLLTAAKIDKLSVMEAANFDRAIGWIDRTIKSQSDKGPE